MRSLQLIPLIVHLALSVPRLLPGAIVHQHGTTACVEDSIMVKLRISPTSLLEPISKLQNDLQEIQKNINRQVPNNTHQNYETSQILYHNVNSLQSKLNKIKYTIYHLPDPDNDTINTRRTKRGLFDFVGIISKSLFGTATDQDIHTVDTHIGKITRVLQQQGKLIDLNSQNIDLLADSVNSVIDKYNYLAQFTNTQLSQITNSQTALFFLYHLNNLDKELDSLKDHTNLIQKDIWNAHAGVVDSQMITPTQLTQTLRRAHSTLQLTPFFSKHEIQHYYPILASTIFQQFILINIPMDPVKRFSLWEIYPFPYPYQNRTMILNLPTSTILKSTDESAWCKMADEGQTHPKPRGFPKTRGSLRQSVILNSKENRISLQIAAFLADHPGTAETAADLIVEFSTRQQFYSQTYAQLSKMLIEGMGKEVKEVFKPRLVSKCQSLFERREKTEASSENDDVSKEEQAESELRRISCRKRFVALCVFIGNLSLEDLIPARRVAYLTFQPTHQPVRRCRHNKLYTCIKTFKIIVSVMSFRRFRNFKNFKTLEIFQTFRSLKNFNTLKI
ncbi:uncharacterized protein LOC143023930 [Oratosquilla oratoria]|uniref:uncharacterized protein LOC143023930 n=1 Tax=Oratosquilla oratoria TaxID=337810 RepID=UPI003F75E9F8